jgi:chemotaxis protein CheZ
MAKRFKFDDSGDSEELQALFDSIAAQSQSGAKQAHIVPLDGNAATGDSPELEALFDSVARQAARAAAQETAPAQDNAHEGENVFRKIGQLTRQLHDTLRELGYSRALEEAAKAIPDARQRLAYVAQLTEQAASRVLNATDVARPIQDELQRQAAALSGRWESLFAGALSVDEFKVLAADTRAYLKAVPERTAATNAQLMEIMMAQDFQDLTGQVIKKIVDLAQRMESELLQVLIEAMPQDMRAETPAGLMNGPVIDAAGRADVVSSQEQVDELLESLGF